jgi:hypothetical protein
MQHFASQGPPPARYFCVHDGWSTVGRPGAALDPSAWGMGENYQELPAGRPPEGLSTVS